MPLEIMTDRGGTNHRGHPEVSAAAGAQATAPPPRLHWYAIRTKPRQEEVARLNYQRQGYEVYLPLMRVVVRHARRVQEKLNPFFPGYLFLRLDGGVTDWTAVCSTRGVLAPVRFGDRYPPVPDWVIADLQAREEHGGISLAARQREQLVPGTPVTVQLDGETTSQAIFFSFRGKDNVVILLNLLNRQVKTTLPLDQITSNPNGARP